MYFQTNGFKRGTNFKEYFNNIVIKHKRRNKFSAFFEKNRELLKFLSADLKKNVMSFFSLNHNLELYRGQRGLDIILTFRFFLNNMRGLVYVENFGFILCNLTGGFVAKKVLEVQRVYKRDKKGDGTLNYIGRKVRRSVKKCLRRFYIARIKLYLTTYFRRYVFFKLIRRFVYKRLRRQVFLRIPRGHNSLESAKRWRRRRR